MHENLKKWLSRYSEAQADLDDLRARRDALIQRSEAARTSVWDDIPHGKGDHADPTGIMAVRIEDLNAEITERVAEADVLYHEIEATIQRIRCKHWADLRCVLRCRYLDRWDWNTTAEILFERRYPDFEERSENFVRRTHLLHAKALEALEILVPDLCGTGNGT